MATRERVIFNLDRFEWTGPGWLQVWGGWDGMDRRDLADPALIVHARSGSRRLAPPPDGIRGGIRNWHAIFPWDDDPAAIDGAELELGGTLVVELPAPGSSGGRRRFGRTRLAVRELDSEDSPQTAEAPVSGPAPEADPIVVHLAVVAAREEAAEAREELKVARAAASRAAEDAAGERARRQGEATRLHEAMETLRQLAEESLHKERGVAQRLSAEIDGYEKTATDERALASGLRDQMQSLSSELIEAQETVEAARAEADGLRLRVEEVEREARQATAGNQTELESLRTDVAESRQVAASWSAEADRTRAQLAEAQRELERAQAEIEQLRAHFAEAEREAHRAGGEVERLRARFDEAQEQFERSGAQAEQLRAQLGEAQGLVERSSTEAERLRAELQDAQGGAQEAESEAERLRRSLAAVREALQQG